MKLAVFSAWVNTCWQPIYKVMIVCSAACFIVGTALLAYSIKWRSEALSKDDKSELAENVREKGSPGRTDVTKLKIGMILNAVGYVLLVISTIILP